MASNRHLGRIVALQTLYEFDFRTSCEDKTADLDEILERNIDRYEDTIEDTSFVRDLVQGVASRSQELDDTIAPIAPEWPIEQIARIDKVVLRIALYELLHQKEVPPKVAINEAVELSKAFGGDNSSKFVNGVLGTAFRQHEEADAKPAAKKKPAVKKKPAAKKKKTS